MRAPLLATLPALALVLSSAPARAQAEALSAVAASRDGLPEDIAGPRDARANPMAARVWVAHGWLRSAYRAADRQRMFAEDVTFPANETGVENEHLVALELDETNSWLYTLTRARLYVDDVSDPSSPKRLAEIELGHADDPPAFPAWDRVEEPALDLKVWGPDKRAFVLTSKRIVVVDASSLPSGSLAFESEALDLVNAPLGYLKSPGDLLFNMLKFRELRRLRVIQDSDGSVVAFVEAVITGYAGSSGRPKNGPFGILGCKLAGGGDYSSPSFDAVPGPGKKYVWWNPLWDIPRGVAAADEVKQDNTMHSLDGYVDGQGERLLLAACGIDKQVQQLDVTDSFALDANGDPKGVTRIQSFSLDHNPATPELELADVYSVLADPWRPDRFFAYTPAGFHVYDASSPLAPQHAVTVDECFGDLSPVGGHRDMIAVRIPRPPHGAPAPGPGVSPPPGGNGYEAAGAALRRPMDTVWTALAGNVDAAHKVIDVTTDEQPLRKVDAFFNLLSSDGGVALGDHVYLPYWGGVVRYARDPDDPGVWWPVPESYQPAMYTGSLGQTVVSNTESIDLAQADGVDRLLTDCAHGGFLDYPIESTSGNPQAPTFFAPDASALNSATGWDYPNGSYYSNDLAFLDLDPSEASDGKFVLLALTNFDVHPGQQGQTVQHALLAYRWETSTGRWVHVATAAGCEIDVNKTKLNQSVIAFQEGSKAFAFLGHAQGFLSFDVTDLTATTPQMSVVSQVFEGGSTCGNDPGGWPIAAIARSRDRLITMVNNGNGVRARLYDWDESTGAVSGPVGSDFTDFEVDGSAIDPGNAQRARFHETDSSTGEGYALFACDPYVIEMHWPGSGDPDTLEFSRYWLGDPAGVLQDCRVHDFGEGPHMLVVRTSGGLVEVPVE